MSSQSERNISTYKVSVDGARLSLPSMWLRIQLGTNLEGSSRFDLGASFFVSDSVLVAYVACDGVGAVGEKSMKDALRARGRESGFGITITLQICR